MTKGFCFRFNRRAAINLFIFLVATEIIICAVFVTTKYVEIPRALEDFFRIDTEASLPAWFSTIQIFLVGVLFLFANSWNKIEKVSYPYLLVFAGFGFIFLSADESAAIHERITYLLRDERSLPRFKGDHGIWIPIYFSIFFIMIIISARTIWDFINTYSNNAIYMIVGFMITIIGGIGMEVTYWYLVEDSRTIILELTFKVIEEFLEMFGISILLFNTILCSIKEIPNPSPKLDGVI